MFLELRPSVEDKMAHLISDILLKLTVYTLVSELKSSFFFFWKTAQNIVKLQNIVHARRAVSVTERYNINFTKLRPLFIPRGSCYIVVCHATAFLAALAVIDFGYPRDPLKTHIWVYALTQPEAKSELFTCWLIFMQHI